MRGKGGQGVCLPVFVADGCWARYRRVAYYPGCALEGTAHAYNASTRAVGKALGLALDEVPNWNCCGAMEVKNIDPKVQTYLSARVMAIALHPFIMGQPHRIASLARALDYISGFPKVWKATGSEIIGAVSG